MNKIIKTELKTNLLILIEVLINYFKITVLQILKYLLTEQYIYNNIYSKQNFIIYIQTVAQYAKAVNINKYNQILFA